MIRLVPYFVVVVLFAVLLGATHQAGYNTAAREFAAVQTEQRNFLAKSEANRLAIQSERDRLARELEDEANAAPVAYPACIDADRLRRLNAIR